MKPNTILAIFLLLIGAFSAFAQSALEADLRTNDQLVAAAQSGEARAMFLLGERYKHALGVDRDISSALDGYRKALAAGYPKANERIAELFWDGTTGTQDLAQALTYLRKG